MFVPISVVRTCRHRLVRFERAFFLEITEPLIVKAKIITLKQNSSNLLFSCQLEFFGDP